MHVDLSLFVTLTHILSARVFGTTNSLLRKKMRREKAREGENERGRKRERVTRRGRK